MPGRHVGNATMVHSRTNWCASSLRYALISGELGSNLRLVCMVSPSAPHPNGNVRVFPLPVGRHRDFEDTGGLISNVTEEEIAVVVHSASRNIVRQARGMFESSDFLSLDRLGIEAPYHALILFPRFGGRIIFRITPVRGHVVKLSIAPEFHPPACGPDNTYWKIGVPITCGRLLV